LLGIGVAYGYMSLIIALIAIACTQFDKIKAAILDIRQHHVTHRHGQEDVQDNAITNCDLQAKLSACVRHHQDVMK